MSRIIHIDELPSVETLDSGSWLPADAGKVTTKLVFGMHASLGILRCAPGYHPYPHVHQSEQINYVAEGEILFFVEERAYHLRAGDFIRVPQGVLHWMWNRSDSPCALYESNCPPLVASADVRNSPSGLFDADDARPAGDLPQPVWLSREYCEKAEAAAPADQSDGLFVRGADLPISVHTTALGSSAAGKLTSKVVHGLAHNLMLATRVGGYHSKPHTHDCEQINFLVKGDMWGFTPDRAFHRRSGDLTIVPRNTPHWAWVPSDGETILLEVHSPVLGSAVNRKALLRESEKNTPFRVVRNMVPWNADELWEREGHLKSAVRRSAKYRSA